VPNLSRSHANVPGRRRKRTLAGRAGAYCEVHRIAGSSVDFGAAAATVAENVLSRMLVLASRATVAPAAGRSLTSDALHRPVDRPLWCVGSPAAAIAARRG